MVGSRSRKLSRDHARAPSMSYLASSGAPHEHRWCRPAGSRDGAEHGTEHSRWLKNDAGINVIVVAIISPPVTMSATGTEPLVSRRSQATPRRQAIILAAATLLMLAVAMAPTPPPLQRAGNLIALTAEGQTCLAIMAFAITLWITEAMPFAATSLLVLLLIPAFGIANYRAVVQAGFGDPIVTFILGTLMLSAAFTRSGLGTRLAYHVLLRVGTRTDRVLLGLLVVGAAISMWIPDVAVAAMLLPVGVGLLRDAGLRPGESQFGRALMIAVAFGPLIGGIATPAGTSANLVAMAQLKQLAGIELTFATWMAYG